MTLNFQTQTLEFDTRPWGSYLVLDSGLKYKIKKILVKPGGQLSYQYHEYRDETWIILEGTGVVRIGALDSIASEGMQFNIAALQSHSISNKSKTNNLIFLEIATSKDDNGVQEDDIIRLEDKYGRADND